MTPPPSGKGDMGKGSMSSGKGYMGTGMTPPPSGKGNMGKGSMPSGKGYMGEGMTPPPSGKGNMSKGSMPPPGKGSMPLPPSKGAPKGSSKGASVCRFVPIFMYKQDLHAGFEHETYGNGGSLDSIPFYNVETGEHLGYYSDSAAYLASGDCVGNGEFTFIDQSQISIQFTCFGTFNSITGGTGQFGCASGYEEYSYQDGVVFATSLHICTGLCSN